MIRATFDVWWDSPSRPFAVWTQRVQMNGASLIDCELMVLAMPHPADSLPFKFSGDDLRQVRHVLRYVEEV